MSTYHLILLVRTSSPRNLPQQKNRSAPYAITRHIRCWQFLPDNEAMHSFLNKSLEVSKIPTDDEQLAQVLNLK